MWTDDPISQSSAQELMTYVASTQRLVMFCTAVWSHLFNRYIRFNKTAYIIMQIMLRPEGQIQKKKIDYNYFVSSENVK